MWLLKTKRSVFVLSVVILMATLIPVIFLAKERMISTKDEILIGHSPIIRIEVTSWHFASFGPYHFIGGPKDWVLTYKGEYVQIKNGWGFAIGRLRVIFMTTYGNPPANRG